MRVGRNAKPLDTQEWKIAPTALPEMPEIGQMAKGEFDRIAKYLIGLDRIAEVDRQALTVYCTQWAHFAQLMKSQFIQPNAKLYTYGRNCDVVHPLLSPLLKSAKLTIKMAGQFGLTARTRDLESDHGNRKASALKRLMGNQRKIAEDKLPPSILNFLPEFDKKEVACPHWLPRDAKAEYKRLGKDLTNLDLFTPLDVVPVAIVSCLFDLYMRSVKQIKESGYMTEVMNRLGEVVEERAHPLHGVMIDLHDTMRHIWKDYGQTPRFRKVFNGERKAQKEEIPLIFKGKFAS